MYLDPYPCGNMTIHNNTDFYGGDIDVYVDISWSACCSLCLLNPACQGYTWRINARNCYLKGTINPDNFDSNCTSAKYP